jgi:AcrR family transcriptional regulator
MSQPSVYSRDDIVEAAFELVRERGWQSVTTRAIAMKMGSSTMPIYSHVRSVNELEKELRQKARVLLRDYQQRSYTDEILLNLAFGYVVFARDEKKLFRFLYLEKPENINAESDELMKDTFFSEFGPTSAAGIKLSEMKETGQDTVVRYAWIFTHGLAMLVNAGVYSDVTDQAILKYLMNAGEAFYTWGIRKGGETDDYKG